MTIPLFPLGTVLFTGGHLPLRIFEPRYLKMIQQCRKNDTGFGIVLIKDGHEVHTNQEDFLPELYSIGTLAELLHVEEEEQNTLSILVRGVAKFRVDSTWVEEDHLRMGEVTFLQDEPLVDLDSTDSDLKQLLENLTEAPGFPEFVRESIDWNDARDIGNRLAEYLPFANDQKQELLQIESARLRIARIRTILGVA